MALTSSEMSPADIRACTEGNSNDGFGGGNWAAWIILFLIFGAFGWGGNGGFGGFGGGNSGVAEGYTLASDFATIQRQLSDGFNAQERRTDAIINGICDLGYTQQSLANSINMNVAQNGYESRLATTNLGSQLASCCCDVREAISGVNYNMAMNTNEISRGIERGFADTNYNIATTTCATQQAIDKVGDRIIDYLANDKLQTLRDENAALRLRASQEAQNRYLVSELGYHCPQPAYVVQPPQQVTFPTNCCGGVNYAAGGCGCGA